MRLTDGEVKRPLQEPHVNDEANTLFGSSEVRRYDERNVFGDILEGIAQEEREAWEREEEGEVNQPSLDHDLLTLVGLKKWVVTLWKERRR